MKIGIRAHDIGTMEKDELAKAVNEKGFSGIQLVLHKAFVDETGEAGTLSEDKAVYIKEVLDKNNVEVAMLGAYFNPVHSNPDTKQKAVAKFMEHLQYARTFGTHLVGTETGSYNDDEWTYNPKNHTDEALDEVIETLKPLVKQAEKYNTYLAIEPVYNHIVSTPKRMKYVLDELNSENVRVTVDFLNLIQIDKKEDYKSILQECFELFGDKIELFHFKNFNVNENGDVEIASLKDGYFDYEYIVNEIKEKYDNVYCIFEDLTNENIDISKTYIDELVKR